MKYLRVNALHLKTQYEILNGNVKTKNIQTDSSETNHRIVLQSQRREWERGGFKQMNYS